MILLLHNLLKFSNICVSFIDYKDKLSCFCPALFATFPVHSLGVSNSIVPQLSYDCLDKNTTQS
jgi:hypothetical protein